jgi:ketosteroid isomerase-like protein
MIFVRRLCLLLPLALALVASAASAQTWSADQQELWKLEELQWKMSADKDLTWIDKMVHPNISYWGNDQVAPQNKASLIRWNRYTSGNSTVKEQELFPISMTITGNVAVAQYRYTVASEDYKKEKATVSGRYTDIFLKDGGQWKFIAWAGGDDPKK